MAGSDNRSGTAVTHQFEEERAKAMREMIATLQFARRIALLCGIALMGWEWLQRGADIFATFAVER
jgi:hypothetical protein